MPYLSHLNGKNVSLILKKTSAIAVGGGFALFQIFNKALSEFLNTFVSQMISEIVKKTGQMQTGTIIAIVAGAYLLKSLRSSSSNERKHDDIATHQLLPDSVIGADSSLINVPNKHNEYFIGREDVIQALDDGFSIDGRRIQAIVGLPGVGKTQTAYQFAIRYLNKYSKIHWVNADTYNSLIDDIRKIAIALHLPGAKEESDRLKVVEDVKQYLIVNKGWLLILDNSDDLNVINNFIKENLPLTSGQLLMTTRDQNVRNISPAVHYVREMSVETGAEFIINKSGINDSISTRDEAKELANILGGLPFALDQAAAYISEMQISIADYIAEYQSRKAKILSQRNELSYSDNSVYVLIDVVFDKILKNNAAAADILRICAFFEPDNIPEEIFYTDISKSITKSIANNGNINLLLREITRFSLLQRNFDNKSISIHRLVRDVLKEIMSERQKRDLAEKILQGIRDLLPEVEYSTWSVYERFAFHKNAIIKLINEYNYKQQNSIYILSHLGYYLHKCGLNFDPEFMYKRALEISIMMFGEDEPSTTMTMELLANLYVDQGKYDEGEPLYHRVLEIRKTKLSNDHPDTGTTMHALANLYLKKGMYDDAEHLYNQALEIRKLKLGEDHPSTTATMHQLANLYVKKGKYDEAEQLYTQDLEICKVVFGEDHLNTAITMQQLANLYVEQNKYDEAEQLYNEVYKIRSAKLGDDHPVTSAIIHFLANLYAIRGRYDDAEKFYIRALEIRKIKFGEHHTNTATTMFELAKLYVKVEKYDEAEQLYNQSLEIRKLRLGDNHPDTFSVVQKLEDLKKG